MENNSEEVLDITAESTTIEERLHLPPKKRALLIISAVAAVIVLAAVLTAVIVMRRACVKPVRQFFRSVETSDGEAFAECLPPWVIDSFKGESPAEYYEENMLKESLAELEEDYGDRIRISMREEQRVRLDESGLKKLEKQLGEGTDIAKAYDLVISYTVKGSMRSETKRREFTVCKTEGRWVIAGVPNTIL
ncbi:MAG: hypothetical protein K6B74_05645 [Ruminococcus sp.]|nr:hypothetical protein [Ruminococcus sp.]